MKKMQNMTFVFFIVEDVAWDGYAGELPPQRLCGYIRSICTCTAFAAGTHVSVCLL